ncbi:MAG TPA: acyltransferase [Alphaproteobacteria bacterium]|nr:acyltransferase [Alphaproteobacteria bacterium]HOO49912.1 acyltransferase [Alphaproteobacteria bacterium]
MAHYFLSHAHRAPQYSAELHAVRGLAALLVFISHIYGRLESSGFSYSVPLLFNGSAAVILFFVLSGLVVGLSLSRHWDEPAALFRYGVRRFFRLMPLMFVLTSSGGIYLFTFNPHMTFPLFPESFGNFGIKEWIAGYIGYSLKANPPSWSIFIELVGSALLPLFIFLSARKSVFLILGAALFVFAAFDIGMHHWNFYMMSFWGGMSIVVWGAPFATFINSCRVFTRCVMFGVCFAAFYVTRLVWGGEYGDAWIVYVETLSIVPLLAYIYYGKETFSALRAPIFKFFGDISFSLYLSHYIILAILINLLYGMGLNTIVLIIGFCVLSLVICIPVSLFLYRWVETPALKLGKAVLKKR